LPLEKIREIKAQLNKPAQSLPFEGGKGDVLLGLPFASKIEFLKQHQHNPTNFYPTLSGWFLV